MLEVMSLRNKMIKMYACSVHVFLAEFNYALPLIFVSFNIDDIKYVSVLLKFSLQGGLIVYRV